MRIAVTGASGFIGQHRVKHLKSLGHEVIAIARSRNNNADYSYVDDLSEPLVLNYITNRHFIDRIEHYAAIATVNEAKKNPWYTYKVNTLATVSVLETAKEYDIPVLHWSTDKCYGQAGANESVKISDEGNFLLPHQSPYENSKMCGDMIAQSYGLQGAKITIIRSCNIFGNNDTNSRIIPNTIRTLQEGKSPVVYTNIQGHRQYIYIDDVMSATDMILDKAPGNIFNIGTDIYLMQAQVVDIITQLWNKKHNTDIKLDFQVKEDWNEIPDQYLVWDRLKTLGWKPKYPNFEDGIGEML